MIGHRPQQGIALLVILTMLAATMTVVAITALSLNQLRGQNQQLDARRLALIKEALIGYALAQQPPGTLPCPDSDFPPDGLADGTAGGCQNRRGWLPWRTLSLTDQYDSSGVRFWYAVDPAHTALSSLQRNSDLQPSLTLDGMPMVAVVVAAGYDINGQDRSSGNANRWLEDINGDANQDTYARSNSSDANDILLGIAPNDFWPLMEQQVLLPEVDHWLEDWRTRCGSYPWASPFGSTPANSQNNLTQGGLPVSSPQPTCANAPSLASWVEQHWDRQLYYQFCTSGTCLTINGDKNLNARRVVMAPGAPLAGQNRPSSQLSDYYEEDNALSNDQFELRNKAGTTINDRIIAPEF